MEAWEKYLEAEKGYLEEIRRTQWETIMSAAKAVADATMSGGLIRVFGVGHSHLIADDVFYPFRHPRQRPGNPGGDRNGQQRNI